MESNDPVKRLEETPPRVPRPALLATALALTVILGLMIGFWWIPKDDDPPSEKGRQSNTALSGDTVAHLLAKWDRPAVALIFSGQQLGYLQPCGCSHPQYGGLTRRYNLLQRL